MTIKQQLTIQKVLSLASWHFSSHSSMSHCESYSITSPALFNKNNKLWNERKENLLCIWLFQRIMLYQRR